MVIRKQNSHYTVEKLEGGWQMLNFPNHSTKFKTRKIFLFVLYVAITSCFLTVRVTYSNTSHTLKLYFEKQ